MENEYLGVSFDDWRKQTVYKVEPENYKCRLCNKTFRWPHQHKKNKEHKKLYDLFEDKRYDYIIYEQKRKMGK